MSPTEFGTAQGPGGAGRINVRTLNPPPDQFRLPTSARGLAFGPRTICLGLSPWGVSPGAGPPPASTFRGVRSSQPLWSPVQRGDSTYRVTMGTERMCGPELLEHGWFLGKHSMNAPCLPSVNPVASHWGGRWSKPSTNCPEAERRHRGEESQPCDGASPNPPPNGFLMDGSDGLRGTGQTHGLWRQTNLKLFSISAL